MPHAIDAPYTGMYQVAYVTNDFERALRQFADTHRIERFMELRAMRYSTIEDRAAICNVALAYAGAIEIEVIEPLEGDIQVYRDYLPDDDRFTVHFHHVSQLFDSEAELERQVARHRAAGRPLPIDNVSPGMARYFYADCRAELGHYLEGIYFQPAALGFLASIPRF